MMWEEFDLIHRKMQRETSKEVMILYSGENIFFYKLLCQSDLNTPQWSTGGNPDW